jgi:hypothetical protein
MTTAPQPPFSARNRRHKAWIEEDFPISARTGLLHLLNDAVNRDYLSGWHVVAKELRRIARLPVQNYDPHSVPSIKEAREDAEIYLGELGWEQVYGFCERLHSHLAQGTVYEQDGEAVTDHESAITAVFR